MEWSDSLGLALVLLLVFEGLMPLFAPQQWRELFAQLMQLRDGQLRFCGLFCIAAGIILLILL